MSQAKMRSDKRKNPTMLEYRLLTYDECRSLKYHHCYVLDRYGDIAQVNITTVKTWKRRPDLEIHWKFGLYEYGQETVRPNEPQTFFITLIV